MSKASLRSQAEVGKKEWTYTLEAKADGKFVGNWGVAILPNQDEGFFTKDNGEGGFAITEKGNNSGVGLVPAVFYTYVPNYDPNKEWVNGPSLGLGLDQENLSLFAGWSLFYRTRMGITAGLAVHKQERLLGEFTAGQILKESTETLTDEDYDLNLFLGFVYSFGD